MLFVVDVDSAILEGTAEQRRMLRNALTSDERVKVVYSSCRGLESIIPAIDDPLTPSPDYVIADSGATVVDGDLRPVQPLQMQIEQCWPGQVVVEQALKGIGGLKRQDVPHQRRCAYVADRISDELRKIIEELDCEVVMSRPGHLDVLPKGVSRGKSLLRLIELEQLENEQLIVVGDALDDPTILEDTTLTVHGIACQELPLENLKRKAQNTDIYVSEAEGAEGVLQGLVHYDFIDAGELKPSQVELPSADVAPLVMVYHRMPFAQTVEDGQTVLRPHKSPNGIIPTLLGFFSSGRSGCWVAWNEAKSRGEDSGAESVIVDPERYPNLRLSCISLTAKDVKQFYYTFSKEAFWPIIFSFPGKCVFNRDHWEHYVEINKLFAARVAAQAEKNAIVWIHDYNLWMVPGQLREMRPDVRIVFFHHTSFPAPDVFNVIPWRRELIGSLLQCDYVSFHIPSYACNFAAVVQTYAKTKITEWRKCAPRYISYGCAMSVDSYPARLESQHSKVRLGVHPVGINVDRIEELLQTVQTQQRIQDLRSELGGKKVVLSLERLDYVKGPTEKLKTFEKFLESHPELHGDIVLVNVCTPPAPGMEVYKRTREQVDQIVGRINGRFGQVDWTPIVYLYRSLPYEEVIAYYAAADVAWITPLRDGLNLVAKEFAAVKGILQDAGSLILSEFAGAAVELFGAILVNPYDEADMLRTLEQAVLMNEDEKRIRINQLFDVVREHDISRWARDFLTEIDSL